MEDKTRSLGFMSLAVSARQIREGDLSPLELAEALISRIERLEPHLNAFVTLAAELTLEQAREATEALSRPHAGDTLGPLHGVPLAIKDLYDVKGLPTTAGSGALRDNIAQSDAYAVGRLRDAGAIFVGKTQTHEWAFGTTTNNPHFGPARNPWDLERIPGGSSGGNAAGLAAGLFAGSLGSDTGGSIRIPAALCGVVGLKPTRGRVSLRGVVPLSWTLDHAGPMARSVEDVALLLSLIEGYDRHDPASRRIPSQGKLRELDPLVKGLRIGVPTDYFWEDVDQEVDALVREAIEKLAGLGAIVVEMPRQDWAATFRSSGRMLVADAAAAHKDRMESHPEQYGDDILERLQRGQKVSGPVYADARRKQAEWQRKLQLLFEEVDLIAAPTVPEPARTIESADAVATARVLTSLTAPFNLTGAPAISMPCGFTAGGLPVGLQVVAPWWHESRLLRAARAFEAATDWAEMTPPIEHL